MGYRCHIYYLAALRSILREHAHNGTRSDINVEWEDKHAACVIAASEGYPQSYKSGFELTIPDEVRANTFVAGAALDDGVLKTHGGRVLGVTVVADTLAEAIGESYKMIDKIEFENKYFRRDIGRRALEAGK